MGIVIIFLFGWNWHICIASKALSSLVKLKIDLCQESIAHYLPSKFSTIGDSSQVQYHLVVDLFDSENFLILVPFCSLVAFCSRLLAKSNLWIKKANNLLSL